VFFCVLGCFSGLRFEAICGLRLLRGRIATFHVDAMLKLLSVTGGFWDASFSGIGVWRLVFQASCRDALKQWIECAEIWFCVYFAVILQLPKCVV